MKQFFLFLQKKRTCACLKAFYLGLGLCIASLLSAKTDESLQKSKSLPIIEQLEAPKETLPKSNAPLEPHEKAFVPSAKMRTEAIYLVRFLEELHFTKKSIKDLDAKQLIEDYLSSLDANRMVFLQEHVDQFVKRFSGSMDILLRGGSLLPAFEMFNHYYTKTNLRLDWVLNRLEKNFDFSAQDTFFEPDRKNAKWPLTEQEADNLWEQRLKYELLNEILALKTKQEEAEKMIVADGEGSTQKMAREDKKEEAPLSVELAEKRIQPAKETVKKRYEHLRDFLKKIDEIEVQEVFLNVLSHLYDPHTNFLSEGSMEDLSISLRNSLVGIGAYLSEENGYCVVKELLPGGPAENSKKIRPGDKILSVAQENEEPINIYGMKLRQSVKLIRGPKGTKVNLLIQPVDGNPSDRREVQLTRDEIKLTYNLASAKLYEVPNKQGQSRKIGLIDLPAFYGGDEGPGASPSNNTTDDVKTLIQKLKLAGMEGLILDLRRNGGGLLNEAVRLAGIFLEKCPVVQVKDTSGKVQKQFAEGNYVEWDGPLLILVSRFSASASEIVAGALKNHARALIFGDKSTHGKGTVQAIIEMDRLSLFPRPKPYLGAAKITIQKWYLPDGSSTQQKGVQAHLSLPSFYEVLPISESDLPHALSWDSIEAMMNKLSSYSQPYAFVNSELIHILKTQQEIRCRKNEAFRWLQEQIAYLKAKYNQVRYSLNLKERIEALKQDNEYRKLLEAKAKELARNSKAFTPIYLPNAEPKIQADPSESKGSSQEDFDIYEDESVEIMTDWLACLKKNQAKVGQPNFVLSSKHAPKVEIR